MLSDTQKFYLATYRKTLQYLARYYPAASKEYKRSSFVVGAQDMAHFLMENEPSSLRREYAKEIDKIRNEIFPPKT